MLSYNAFLFRQETHDELRRQGGGGDGSSERNRSVAPEALHRAGAKLVLADAEADALEEAAARIGATNASVLAVPTDVASRESVGALADKTLEHFTRVDLLFNNAGVSTFNPIANQTLDDWKRVLGVNLWGVIHGIDAFLPILREQAGPAHIFNTASIAGVLSGLACIGPYAVSKVIRLRTPGTELEAKRPGRNRPRRLRNSWRARHDSNV